MTKDTRNLNHYWIFVIRHHHSLERVENLLGTGVGIQSGFRLVLRLAAVTMGSYQRSRPARRQGFQTRATHE
jgi:hypothetical protein